MSSSPPFPSFLRRSPDVPLVSSPATLPSSPVPTRNEPLASPSGGGYSSVAAPSLPYMTESELTQFLAEEGPALSLSHADVEYLYERRRRLSLEMHESLATEGFGDVPGSEGFPPLKIMILGSEDSGKTTMLQLFTLPHVVHKYPELLDENVIPPCDIQRKIVNLHELASSSASHATDVHAQHERFCLELWLPECTSEYDEVRSMYYAATDVFLLVFSLRDPRSFEAAKLKFMEEIRTFRELHPRRNTPVILVGQFAEARMNSPDSCVASEDAVAFAKSSGILKYVETFSNNTKHVNEVFRQAALAAHQMRDGNKSMTRLEYESEYAHEDSVLRKYLSLRRPTGHFDVFTRTFLLDEVSSDVVYLFTLDGSLPTRVSPRYNGPISLKKPYPKTINVIALCRCKFASAVTSFHVPKETPIPRGHFDALAKAFFLNVLPGDDYEYYYTLDGSKPDLSSKKYDYSGIYFDDGPHLGGVVSTRLPSMIRVFAFGRDMFRSPIADFPLPDLIEPPHVTYVEKDNMLLIDTEANKKYRNYEFRYSLDGSIPTIYSKLYTGPVLLPPNPSVTKIRIAAFPRMRLPSRVVEVQRVVRESAHHSGLVSKNQPTRAAVRMTRSSLGRIQTGSGRTGGTILSPRGDQSDLDVSHGRILYESPSSYPSEGYSQPVENSLGPSPVGSPRRSKSAPRGTVSSPPSGSVPKSTRASSPTGIPSTDSVRKFSPSREYASAVLGDTSSTPYQREPDIPVRPQRGIRAPPTPEEQRRAIRQKASAQFYPKTSDQMSQQNTKKSSSPAPDTASSSGQSMPIRPEWLASVEAIDTSVLFTFTRPVCIDYLLVTTPGFGKGPTAFAISGSSASDIPTHLYTPMGDGRLQDVSAEQKMLIEDEFKKNPIIVLQVLFDAPGVSNQSFQVLDVKLFGSVSNPANVANNNRSPLRRMSSVANMMEGNERYENLKNFASSISTLNIRDSHESFVSSPMSSLSSGLKSSPHGFTGSANSASGANRRYSGL